MEKLPRGFEKKERSTPVSGEHVYAESKPWKDVEAFNSVRSMFDQWRLTEQGLLKTNDDWQRWVTYRSTGSISAKEHGLELNTGGYRGKWDGALWVTRTQWWEKVVELMGLEPTTSTLRTWRSPR